MPYVNTIDWHVNPMRAERWLAVWHPAAERCLSFGASSYAITRSIDDPLHFRQTSLWESKDDFDRYWYSEELVAVREQAINLHHKPVLPAWHSLVVSSDLAAAKA